MPFVLAFDHCQLGKLLLLVYDKAHINSPQFSKDRTAGLNHVWPLIMLASINCLPVFIYVRCMSVKSWILLRNISQTTCAPRRRPIQVPNLCSYYYTHTHTLIHLTLHYRSCSNICLTQPKIVVYYVMPLCNFVDKCIGTIW